MSTRALFYDKSKKQLMLVCPIGAIGASAHPMVAFSGFYESPGPLPLGEACGIVPPHRKGHLNGSKVGTYCTGIAVLFAVALAADGAIRSE